MTLPFANSHRHEFFVLNLNEDPLGVITGTEIIQS